MRHGNFDRTLHISRTYCRSDPTYEAWKLSRPRWAGKIWRWVPILPMRHGNISTEVLCKTIFKSSDPTYEAWKFILILYVLLHKCSSDPTYEAWKSCMIRFRELKQCYGSDPTYEAWKSILSLSYYSLYSYSVPILPMRHGNNRNQSWFGKPVSMFRSYLWGMEMTKWIDFEKESPDVPILPMRHGNFRPRII